MSDRFSLYKGGIGPLPVDITDRFFLCIHQGAGSPYTPGISSPGIRRGLLLLLTGGTASLPIHRGLLLPVEGGVCFAKDDTNAGNTKP